VAVLLRALNSDVADVQGGTTAEGIHDGKGACMSEAVEPGADLGPTASIITIGDEIVEGRVLNENATWLSDELMARGVWPRLVVAVPDVASMIVSVVRVAADAADLVFVTGGLGFTPDDITRHAVATAFFRDVQVDTEVARRFRSHNAWADERIATAAATFPVDAAPLETTSGGVPGFRLRNAYVLPGVPAEMRSMFRGLKFAVECEPIHRRVLTVPTTEDRIRRTLEQFAVGHPAVRLGSYPDLDTDPPEVVLVLVSRSAPRLAEATGWLRNQLACP
jgi:molybdenum cofactor synthesis domain-containing protein